MLLSQQPGQKARKGQDTAKSTSGSPALRQFVDDDDSSESHTNVPVERALYVRSTLTKLLNSFFGPFARMNLAAVTKDQRATENDPHGRYYQPPAQVQAGMTADMTTYHPHTIYQRTSSLLSVTTQPLAMYEDITPESYKMLDFIGPPRVDMTLDECSPPPPGTSMQSLWSTDTMRIAIPLTNL